MIMFEARGTGFHTILLTSLSACRKPCYGLTEWRLRWATRCQTLWRSKFKTHVTVLSGSWKRMPKATTTRRQATDTEGNPDSSPQGHEFDGRTLPSSSFRPLKSVISSSILAECVVSQPFADLPTSALWKSASWRLCSAQPTAAASYHGIAQQACSTAQTIVIGLRPFWPPQSKALPSDCLDDERKLGQAPAEWKDKVFKHDTSDRSLHNKHSCHSVCQSSLPGSATLQLCWLPHKKLIECQMSASPDCMTFVVHHKPAHKSCSAAFRHDKSGFKVRSLNVTCNGAPLRSCGTSFLQQAVKDCMSSTAAAYASVLLNMVDCQR